jgi:3-hydroxyisobutyrate dehydrogenase
MSETVAVLGAGGTMGKGMARNIARAGIGVRAWNRTTNKAADLADDGARVCAAPGEAVEGAGLVLTILSDGDAVVETIREAFSAGAAENVIWLQMSTIGLDATERCAELASDAGLTFVDAPVLGTKKPAEDGELVVFASGASEVRDRVEPVFDAIGKRTMWLGAAGEGTRLKLAINAWILSVVEGVAETMALAEGLGVEPERVLDAIEDGPLDLPYFRLKAGAIMDRAFEPSFRLGLAAKDARLATDAAVTADLDLPLLETIRDRFEEGAREHGDEDMAATFLTSVGR